MVKQRSLGMATAALVVAAIVFSFTLARAVTITRRTQISAPIPVTAAEKAANNDAPEPAKQTQRKAEIARNQIKVAVENDPFQSDRQRPPEHYRMPGEQVEEEPPPPPPPPPPPNFRVVGTIATPQGGIAVVEAAEGTRVLGIGEELNGFTLSRVTARNATVEGNGGRSYSLQIEEPSMRRAANRGGRAGRGGNAPAQQQLLQDMQQRLRDQIERLRQNGAPPQVLEQLMQQLNGGRGGGMLDNIDVIRGANGESQFILRPRGDTATATVRVPARRNNN